MESIGDLRVIGFGNPLCDYIAHTSPAFLKEHSMKPGEARLYDAAADKNLYERMAGGTADPLIESDCLFGAGGSCLNTMLGVQYLLGCKNNPSVGMAGAIGKDKDGETICQSIQAAGLRQCCQMVECDDGGRTGRCAVMIDPEGERALLTDVGVSDRYTPANLKQPLPGANPTGRTMEDLLENAELVYTTGYFMHNCFDTVKVLCDIISPKEHSLLAFSLSAVFVVDYSFDKIMEIMPKLDVLVGNEDEWAAFVVKMGCEGPLEESVQDACKKLPRANLLKPKICICTRGPLSIVVGCQIPEQLPKQHADGQKLSTGTLVQEVHKTPHQVKPMDSKLIVDTTAAGDSWAAGFLYGLCKHYTFDRAIAIGNDVAQRILTKHGFDLDVLEPLVGC